MSDKPEGQIVNPDQRALAEMVLAQFRHESEAAKRDMGLIGRLFGSVREKPGNIAAFAMVLSCVMIVVVALLPGGNDFPRSNLIMLIAGVIPAALGYVFGHVTASVAK